MRRVLVVICALLSVPLAFAGPEADWTGQLNALKRPAVPPMPACPQMESFEPLSDVAGPTLQGFEKAPIPDFTDDMDAASFAAALDKNLAYWADYPDDKPVQLGDATLTAGQVKRSIAALKALAGSAASPQALLAGLRERFDAYKSVGTGGGQATVTAYYEAELDAVGAKDAKHPFPVLLRPKDLIRLDPSVGSPFDYGRIDPRGRLIPYFSRADITAGALAAENLEIAWVAHPTDLLVLQTEGSGFLNMAGGRRRVGFDGANGWPYRSVGQQLIRCGILPAGSTGKPVLDFLRKQPRAREAAYVNLNPRYTFFTVEGAADGSYGAIGQLLTPGRSIAIDPATAPLGGAGLLVTRLPVADADGNITGTRVLTRLVALQDTGAAIRGPGRVDLFLGAGRQADAVGHAMLYPGTLYVFILKEEAWKPSRS